MDRETQIRFLGRPNEKRNGFKSWSRSFSNIFFCQNLFLVGYLVGSIHFLKPISPWHYQKPKPNFQIILGILNPQPLLTIAFRDYHREGLGFFGVIKLAKVFFQGRNHLVIQFANKFTFYFPDNCRPRIYNTKLNIY